MAALPSLVSFLPLRRMIAERAETEERKHSVSAMLRHEWGNQGEMITLKRTLRDKRDGVTSRAL